MKKKQIPVTIITGFLGAGKTTLLNDLLSKNPETNFLIIENEAGEINIDGELLNKANKKNVFELSNGCICCSLNTELGMLLNSIIVSKANYDYMLIEATGMADPAQVINMFSGRRVQQYFKLDGVVSMVDAGLFLKRLNDYVEVRKQIAQSDIALINKTDLVKQDELIEIEQQIHSINPFAQIEKTTYGKTDEVQILNSELFQPSSVEKSIGNFSNLSLIAPKKELAHKIKTLSFTISGDFDMEKISWWLENFLFMNVNNILRIKGILCIEEMQHKLALQSVGDNYHISQGNKWHESEKRESRIVFIGSNLDKDEIHKNLYSLITKSSKIKALSNQDR